MVRERAPGSNAGPLTALVRQVLTVRGSPAEFWQAFDDSLVPIVVLDRRLELLEANHAARLLFRRSHSALLGLKLEQVASGNQKFPGGFDWAQVQVGGSSVGTVRLRLEDEFELTAVYWLLDGAVPGEYLLALSPTGWSDDEWATLRRRAPVPRVRALTNREREVLALVAAGLTVNELSEVLAIAPPTARTHLSHIFKKLRARNKAHAVALAFQVPAGDPARGGPDLTLDLDWPGGTVGLG